MKHPNTVNIHITRTQAQYKTTQAERDYEALRRRAEERMARDEIKRIEQECAGVGL